MLFYFKLFFKNIIKTYSKVHINFLHSMENIESCSGIFMEGSNPSQNKKKSSILSFV